MTEEKTQKQLNKEAEKETKEDIKERSESEGFPSKEEKALIEKAASELKRISKSEYGIYDHFREHPSSILAVFTAAAAFVTFLSQLYSYLTLKNKLEYWDIDLAFLSMPNGNLLYSAIASIIFTLLISVITLWTVYTCEVYLVRKKCLLTYKLLIKKLKKTVRSIGKNIKGMEKSKVGTKEELDNIKKDQSFAKTELGELGKIQRTMQLTEIKEFFFNLLPIFIVIAVASLLVTLVAFSAKKLLISASVMVVTILITFFVIFCLESKSKVRKKEIKKLIAEKSVAEVVSTAKYDNEYPIFSLFENRGKFKSSTFIITILGVVVSTVFFVITATITGISSEEARKDMYITHLGNESYAVVHIEDGKYFLLPAEEDGGVLTVSTETQRIISAEDITLEMNHYSDVIKKPKTDESAKCEPTEDQSETKEENADSESGAE